MTSVGLFLKAHVLICTTELFVALETSTKPSFSDPPMLVVSSCQLKKTTPSFILVYRLLEIST